jgi:hypothetical protein
MSKTKTNTKLVATKDESEFKPTGLYKPTTKCKIGWSIKCKRDIGPDPKNPNLFNGFLDKDLNYFVCNDCKKKFYEGKNGGVFGSQHANKYSEFPVSVPPEPKAKLVKNKVKTSKDVRLINFINKGAYPHRTSYQYNIFERGEHIISLVHNSFSNESSEFGNDIPIYDKIVDYGLPAKEALEFTYFTENSPKGIHISRLYPIDNRIKLFGIEFIHHQKAEVLTPGGIIYIKFKENDPKVIGKKQKSFRLPPYNKLSEAIDRNEPIDLKKVQEERGSEHEVIWELLNNDFIILSWHLNPGVAKAKKIAKRIKKVATKKEKPTDPLETNSHLSETRLDDFFTQKAKKITEKAQNKAEPRTEMFKFRLSSHTRQMISRLTTKLGYESNADMIHLALKRLAQTLPDEFTQEEIYKIS